MIYEKHDFSGLDLDEFIYEGINDGDDNFPSKLIEFLSQMPATHENAKQLLDAIDSYDIHELYQAAFEERFRKFISETELAGLRRKYDEIFDDMLDLEDNNE